MKSLDFEAQSTLSYALSNGILDLDRVHELCMASKREQAKALHPYSITPPAKEGERWRTNYTDRNGKTQTYNTEKLENLNTYLDEMYEQTGDVAFMAVKMNFFMGLRVGELVSLKWEDICEGNQIHIVREEVRDQVANEITVADHTKTHTDRFVYLIPDALEILEKLPKAGEYIFMRDGKRLTSRQINYVLENYAERFNLQVKSSHKLRKTYASMCNVNGVPIDFIREQLGHASLSTTYGYIYNPLTEAESYKMLTDALS